MRGLAGTSAAALAAAFLIVMPAGTQADNVTRPQGSLQQTQPQETQPQQTQPQQTTPQQQVPEQQTAQQEAARQAALSHLTAARNTLAEMTKLPAASTLQGPARTEVNSLIGNFNQLITSSGPEWKENYYAVRQNLSLLLGEKPTATSGTEPVGTSGAESMILDPEVEDKLRQLRENLDHFAEAAGLPESETGSSGTMGSGDPSDQVEEHLDALNAIVDEALGSSDEQQTTVTIEREKLQDILRRVEQLRSAIKRDPQRR